MIEGTFHSVEPFAPTSSYAANGTSTGQGVEYYGMSNVVGQEYQQFTNMGLNDDSGRKERTR